VVKKPAALNSSSYDRSPASVDVNGFNNCVDQVQRRIILLCSRILLESTSKRIMTTRKHIINFGAGPAKLPNEVRFTF